MGRLFMFSMDSNFHVESTQDGSSIESASVLCTLEENGCATGRFFVGDDLEAILSVFGENILDDDPDLASQMDIFTEEMEKVKIHRLFSAIYVQKCVKQNEVWVES